MVATLDVFGPAAKVHGVTGRFLPLEASSEVPTHSLFLSKRCVFFLIRVPDTHTLDRIPFAAASISQVHHAVLVLPESPSGGHGQSVAVEIQSPNIPNSISSNLDETMLLRAGCLLQREFFPTV